MFITHIKSKNHLLKVKQLKGIRFEPCVSSNFFHHPDEFLFLCNETTVVDPISILNYSDARKVPQKYSPHNYGL